jgi:hypothetical protein
MSLYPSYLLVSSKRYKAEQDIPPAFRFRWDDEISDWNFKCRTQDPEFTGPPNPPAVLRFAPQIIPPSQRIGDYRVNVSAWRSFILALNGNDEQAFGWWTNPNTAQFNSTGWPMLMYVGMCGNVLAGERVGEWFKLQTLKVTDVGSAKGMTFQSRPEFIHHFTCVTWDGVNKVTKHIESTGTPRGQFYYPLVTNEGYGFIPWRFVIGL